ncbi:MAG: AAA domain-containing protein [Pirellulaceae bacterium]
MTQFDQFLQQRLDGPGFSTEDCLASFLPLVRDVLDAHAAGKVAPLRGLDRLRVDGVRIFFEQAQRLDPRDNTTALRKIEEEQQTPVEIVHELRRTDGGKSNGDGAPSSRLENLHIGSLDQPISRPVYLPDYIAWEHRLEHHDPLTDVFSLGLLLASMACGLDFRDPQQLERFVAGRRNLFELNSLIHPVLVRAVFRMTELDRHRRPPDLRALLTTLENYRDQEIDLDFHLAQIGGFEQQDKPTKQRVVLGKLRERLFELTRRNRLLHFRPTMQTVNLTQASVPLSFDIKNIRPDQILVWGDDLRRRLVSGKPFSLNKHLNFAEAIYLPVVLDRIIADSRRDLAEFGFAQLRLVVCFLHWADLKQQPPERYESPLVLVPVKLTRKRGVRDTYALEALSSEAEINPVIRYQFKQLYNIDLPESIDLAHHDLEELYASLEQQIQRTESAVTLTKIDRPRIDLIHEKARRKLDQYRRRAKQSGRGVRSFQEIDYSYDPANYLPLGVRLFSELVRPPEVRLRRIAEQTPPPRRFAVSEPPADDSTRQRTLYTLREGAEENPYLWNFDLCGLTLANFKYRKMSLVRDYEALLNRETESPAFDAAFSLSPRPVDDDPSGPPSLDDRFDVVPCDPTQATSVAEARAAKSYIIQGPPGTGKSQTITNLIADYVARGRRVLFCCEKRAAIDVVYARLRQCGLGDLCCLIHDSQSDKKQFVMNLKATYESFLADDGAAHHDERGELLKRLRADLDPLREFSEAMQSAPEAAGVPLRRLIDRRLALFDRTPELTDLQRERLPDYAQWQRHRERIEYLTTLLVDTRGDGVMARHPLRPLSARLSSDERPLQVVTDALASAHDLLRRVRDALDASRIPAENWASLAELQRLFGYAESVAPAARIERMDLFDVRSAAAAQFERELTDLRHLSDKLQQATEAAAGWKDRLPETETSVALQRAKSLENNFLAWLSPSWWRLRSVMNRCYDFRKHVVRPSWSQALTWLAAVYEAEDEFARRRELLAQQYRLDADLDQLVDCVTGMRQAARLFPPVLSQLHESLVDGSADLKPAELIHDVARLSPLVASLREQLDRMLDEYQEFPLEQLAEELHRVERSLDDLPDFLLCLEQLAHLPPRLASALRNLPHTAEEIEAAVAERTLQEIYRGQRTVERFTTSSLTRHKEGLSRNYDLWQKANAAEIRRGVKQRFLEHVHLAGLPDSQLKSEEKEFKKSYNRGRRELEHEFGKSMRYKSIRDLVSGESGMVVKDLKPVWLMSPLSVSDTLPLESDDFDVIIFDEASQITLEEAVPSIFRAPQAIVVGDEMQLPPTDFFSTRRSEDDDELLFEEDGEQVEYDLGSNSFLNHASRNLACTMLGWHYRSRDESLISFSNWAFYEGRLLTVPEECLPQPGAPPLIAQTAEDGAAGATGLLERSISFHFMQHGVYENRRNRAEADYIAELVRAILAGDSGKTIGVVAFSEAQQGEIEQALDRLGEKDAEFRQRLDAELEREEDGQFVGLLVKNLENIQGDERDIIILSICYGRDAGGRMLMNFGPINQSGGEKRLNVAFSRAKHHMAVVTSIRSAAITNEYNDGANCLKNYLRYAEAVSLGDDGSAMAVLHGMSRWRAQREPDAPPDDLVARQIADALRAEGLMVERGVGKSFFRCDVAVRREGDPQYQLAVLVDGESYYSQQDLLERDMMRPRLLEAFGWRVAHVLAKDWLHDREAVLRRLLSALQEDVSTPHASSSDPQ